jgi:Bacterial alpha-L-rhamnosidase 6 hairpin glycosidase domain
LNTIARIGVIDRQHFGGNSWHTPYGPICLHEQYIAQMGLAINDPDYLKGYQQCLDFYRDNAIKTDGRVWARWAYSNEDMMPGEVTDKGFYEAQWGYLLDANPDFVTNVAELYDQTGDIAWVKTHQLSCEKALDWILKRDDNNNGLVEMITDNHTQKRGSDWIDIIWASYENAFVNAKLYHALVLWAAIEKQLGNAAKEKYYQQFAEKMKTSFNKPVTEGGFWNGEKKCYVHWRDKDGSIHGNNMVTPVNFMAIAYGICDDDGRKKSILDGIETQMQKEQLFFWPICMYTYDKGEGNDWQFPFPNYENGDLFLSWGSVAVNAYASYKPELALKYVKNILAQYAKDGLAFQRYGRAKQDGLGDDILSGNSLSVVGLYQAIYGINPLYNRFYLNPHITKELAGTHVNYNYRNQKLVIGLDMNKYSVSNNQFTITAHNDFGFFSIERQLLYFDRHSPVASLTITVDSNTTAAIEVKKWATDEISWSQSSKDNISHVLINELANLEKNSYYSILVNNKTISRVKSNAYGGLSFAYKTSSHADEILILNK